MLAPPSGRDGRHRATPFDSVVVAARKAGLPEEEVRRLPRRWHRYGAVVLLRPRLDWTPPQDLLPEIGACFARGLGATSVGVVRGAARGERREPDVQRIFGPSTVTMLRQDGIAYVLDPTHVLFSPGNLNERIRMGRLDARGEVVVDLFAGVGYFCLPLLVHGGAARVEACDINALSLTWLRQGAAANGVEGRLRTHHGDCRQVAPTGVADRVVLGHWGETVAFLPTAMDAVRAGTLATLHVHDIVATPAGGVDGPWVGALRQAIDRTQAEIRSVQVRRVKAAGAGLDHLVCDLVVHKD